MSIQLLTQHMTFDTAHFDADAENRANAGLTLLQRWTESEGNATWLLFEVNDPAKAKSWLTKARSLGHAPSAAHFLRTA
ncbi:hypothetical protein Q4543_02680 [Salipiger sp. 1_MG-2023]|uniref:DUF3303 family protein n=1 Tax=Salipiger sp. 1_MG-2023 TaxID=3062665 RepID=UPI0026E21AB4|nr:DUF3303 family protein [Salipiger sp. 1_MG-2023]MDO6584413.1 hypothetical protein [Salipiger sp. 1_MG-2023]